MRPLALALVLTACAPDLHADVPAVEACLGPKVDEARGDDWKERSRPVVELPVGEKKLWPMSLMAGMSYRFMVCADRQVSGVELVVYGPDRQAMGSVRNDGGRDASLELTVPTTGRHHVAVRATTFVPGTTSAALGMAVTYK